VGHGARCTFLENFEMTIYFSKIMTIKYKKIQEGGWLGWSGEEIRDAWCSREKAQGGSADWSARLGPKTGLWFFLLSYHLNSLNYDSNLN
jgi:hypothetical protein